MPASSALPAGPRHIVLVGGGMIGSSTLYYLSSRLSSSLPASSTLTLVEASSSLAPGASGKSGGFLAEDWHGATTADLASLSYRLHRELAEEHGGRDRWGYREVDTLSIAYDSSPTRRAAPSLPKALDWLDRAHVTSVSSMSTPGTTAQVTPRPMVQHLARVAQERGAKVLLGTEARGLRWEADKGRVKGLLVRRKGKEEEEDEELPATDVVICAGPWTGRLLGSLLSGHSPSSRGVSKRLSSALHITGSRAHSILVRSSHPTSPHCLFTDLRYGSGGKLAGAPEVYARGDGTVYVCGGSDDVELPESADEVGYDEKATARLREQAAAVAPALDTTMTATTKADVEGSAPAPPAELLTEQACYLPIPSRDGRPVLCADHSSGLHVAAGHSCWGITLGPGSGKVMEELLVDGRAKSADVSRLG